MRVLIVLPGALGDVIRALPLLGRLRRGVPDAVVGWAVEPLSAPLLQAHPWLDAVHVFERRRGVRAVPGFVRTLRAGRYEVAIDLGRGAKSAGFTLASGARMRLGFAPVDAREGSWLVSTRRLPPQGPERSKLEQFLAFGELLDLPPTPVAFGLAPTAAERVAAETLLHGLPRPLLAACLGSSCSSRRWFPEPTAAVVRSVTARRGGSTVLLGTTADRGFAATVSTQTNAATTRDLCGQTTLRGLLAVLAACDGAFGPDSGALHLAAALGKPVVSLWGATSARRSTPYGGERWTIVGDTPCAPCFLKHCPIERVCMQTIAADTVVARITEALAA